jgi:hypothetical protein
MNSNVSNIDFLGYGFILFVLLALVFTVVSVSRMSVKNDADKILLILSKRRGYTSEKDLRKALGGMHANNFCTACDRLSQENLIDGRYESKSGSHSYIITGKGIVKLLAIEAKPKSASGKVLLGETLGI